MHISPTFFKIFNLSSLLNHENIYGEGGYAASAYIKDNGRGPIIEINIVRREVYVMFSYVL